MNRDKFSKIVRRGLMASEGKGIDEQVREVTNRFVYAMEEEAEEAGSGVIETPTFPDDPISSSGGPPVPVMQPARPQGTTRAVEESPLIVLPGSKEAKETEQQNRTSPVRPVRLNRTGQVSANSSAKMRKFWSVEQLAERASALPEKITITPIGVEGTVTLTRSIDSSEPLGTVKVTYCLASQEKPTPSTFTGKPDVAPMSLDLPVFFSMSIYDAELGIEDKMAALLETARKVYGPRPDLIESRTPRRSGPMRFDPKRDPHEDTDMIASPITGEMH